MSFGIENLIALSKPASNQAFIDPNVDLLLSNKIAAIKKKYAYLHIDKSFELFTGLCDEFILEIPNIEAAYEKYIQKALEWSAKTGRHGTCFEAGRELSNTILQVVNRCKKLDQSITDTISNSEVVKAKQAGCSGIKAFQCLLVDRGIPRRVDSLKYDYSSIDRLSAFTNEDARISYEISTKWQLFDINNPDTILGPVSFRIKEGSTERGELKIGSGKAAPDLEIKIGDSDYIPIEEKSYVNLNKALEIFKDGNYQSGRVLFAGNDLVTNFKQVKTFNPADEHNRFYVKDYTTNILYKAVPLLDTPAKPKQFKIINF